MSELERCVRSPARSVSFFRINADLARENAAQLTFGVAFSK
jgi:hypothetical protein